MKMCATVADFQMSEDTQGRLERAHAALAFVGALLDELEGARAALDMANPLLPPTLTNHAQIHAGGMAAVCLLLSGEFSAVLDGIEPAKAQGVRHD